MARQSPKARAAARGAYAQAAKKPLGEGSRFQAIENSASGADNPAAVAASIGIKKYGKAKMAKMAAAGRKKSKGY